MLAQSLAVAGLNQSLAGAGLDQSLAGAGLDQNLAGAGLDKKGLVWVWWWFGQSSVGVQSWLGRGPLEASSIFHLWPGDGCRPAA